MKSSNREEGFEKGLLSTIIKYLRHNQDLGTISENQKTSTFVNFTRKSFRPAGSGDG